MSLDVLRCLRCRVSRWAMRLRVLQSMYSVYAYMRVSVRLRLRMYVRTCMRAYIRSSMYSVMRIMIKNRRYYQGPLPSRRAGGEGEEERERISSHPSNPPSQFPFLGIPWLMRVVLHMYGVLAVLVLRSATTSSVPYHSHRNFHRPLHGKAGGTKGGGRPVHV